MHQGDPYAKLGGGALDQELFKSKQPPHSPIETKQESPQEKKQIKKNNKITEDTEPVIIEQEIRMTLPLPASSLSYLDQIERTIFTKRDLKHRSKQRITKNNVVRCWISLLKEIEIDWTNIKDDADILNRLRKVIKKKV